MKNIIKSVALAMALTIPAIASAEVTANHVTVGEVRITYTAADAQSSYGRKELERQIRRAAKKVCGSQSIQRARSVRQLMENRSCYDKAVENAMRSISTNA